MTSPSSRELYKWWTSSEWWYKSKGGYCWNLHQQILGHHLWHTVGQPWCSGSMQAAGIIFNWWDIFKIHLKCNWYFLCNDYRGTVIFKCSLWIWKWFLTSWPAQLHWERTNLAQLFSQWNRSHLILLWPWWWCWCQVLRLVDFDGRL